jgi:hypothetical protein
LVEAHLSAFAVIFKADDSAPVLHTMRLTGRPSRRRSPVAGKGWHVQASVEWRDWAARALTANGEREEAIVLLASSRK